VRKKRTLLGRQDVASGVPLSIVRSRELLQDLEDLWGMVQAEQEYRRTGGRDFERAVRRLKGSR
jgi:hypothetical protein